MNYTTPELAEHPLVDGQNQRRNSACLFVVVGVVKETVGYGREALVEITNFEPDKPFFPRTEVGR